MTTSVQIPSVNFHLWKPCNMMCEFCFATFRDIAPAVLPKGHLSRDGSMAVVESLAHAGFRKLNFAGGEPDAVPLASRPHWAGKIHGADHLGGHQWQPHLRGMAQYRRRATRLGGPQHRLRGTRYSVAHGADHTKRPDDGGGVPVRGSRPERPLHPGQGQHRGCPGPTCTRTSRGSSSRPGLNAGSCFRSCRWAGQNSSRVDDSSCFRGGVLGIC